MSKDKNVHIRSSRNKHQENNTLAHHKLLETKEKIIERRFKKKKSYGGVKDDGCACGSEVAAWNALAYTPVPGSLSSTSDSSWSNSNLLPMQETWI